MALSKLTPTVLPARREIPLDRVVSRDRLKLIPLIQIQIYVAAVASQLSVLPHARSTIWISGLDELT